MSSHESQVILLLRKHPESAYSGPEDTPYYKHISTFIFSAINYSNIRPNLLKIQIQISTLFQSQ